MTSDQVIVGIDPGLKGALGVLIAGAPVGWTKMPVIAGRVDVHKLYAYLDLWSPSFVGVEQQNIRPQQSGSRTILGNYGRILAVLELAGYAHQEFTPGTWNKAMGVPPGLAGAAKKEHSVFLAKQMFGQSALDAIGLSRMTHDAAEALLIAAASSKLRRV